MDDTLLTELYHVPRDSGAQALAARHAPALYFDAREPFLPLAAGYTIFTQDGPSPSFNRTIRLRPEGKPAAATAIEYAIWWDWDIHHLYELEHAWVYLDAQGAPVRLEGSWHGKYYEIPLKLEGGRAVLLSEPGKHAFAPDPSWFQKRVREFHRPETQAVGLHAHVLINSMFAGKIRARVFDRILVRSYLLRKAFLPTWSFTRRFTFPAEALVPWPELAAWIPARVNAVLERLETTVRPPDYRSMRLVSSSGRKDDLRAAEGTGADAVVLPVGLRNNRLVLGRDSALDFLDLEEGFRFLYSQPVGAFLQVEDSGLVDRLAWFVRSKEMNSYAVILSENAQLLADYNAFVPGGVTAVQVPSPEHNALLAAKESGSAFVHPRWDDRPDALQQLTPGWIEHIHAAGLGIIGWPVADPADLEAMQRLGVDVIWDATRDGNGS